jgi:hypothetical protein
MNRTFSHHGFYNKLKKHKISLAFQGMVSQEMLSLIGLSLKRKSGDNEMLSRRLFAIVVELAQNIYHYSADKAYSEKDKTNVGVGIITISENTDSYTVSSGNLIESSKGQRIKEKCDYINTLDAEGLKQFYKEQRRLPKPEESKGANLGFIDLARKSSNPLKFSITPVSEQHSFFTLSVKIKKDSGE